MNMLRSFTLIMTRLALAFVLLVSPACQSPGVHRDQAANRHFRHGQAYLERGMVEQALAEFDLALEENPRLLDAHMAVGDIYRQRQDFVMAGMSFERAVTVAPASFDAHYYLGLMRQFGGDLTEAVRVYLRALVINPDSFAANQNLAIAYLDLGRPENATPFASRATMLEPHNQAAWANLAAVYSLIGKYDMAVESYREAVELGEMAAPVLLGLAEAHIRLGNYQLASVVLRNLIRREPSPTAYERLGYAQFKLHRFQAALDNFRTALSLDGGEVAALNGVGACLMTLYLQGDRANRSQRNESLQAWRRSVRIEPDQPRVIDLISRYRRL